MAKRENQTSITLDPGLKERVQIDCVRRRITMSEAIAEGLGLWLDPRPEVVSSATPAIAKPFGVSGPATADPSEVLKTEADRELAKALLEWWRSPEEDQLQAHLKRGVAAMLKIEHLLPASLQTKKR
jgi:hypothetical protein